MAAKFFKKFGSKHFLAFVLEISWTYLLQCIYDISFKWDNYQATLNYKVLLLISFEKLCLKFLIWKLFVFCRSSYDFFNILYFGLCYRRKKMGRLKLKYSSKLVFSVRINSKICIFCTGSTKFTYKVLKQSQKLTKK